MIVILSIFYLISRLPGSDQDCLPRWTHKGEEGQHHWCDKVSSSCCENDQSPIDIDTRSASRIDNCLYTENLRCVAPRMAFINNGHNVELNVGFPPHGSPTWGDYVFDRVFFKFGQNDTMGSEHTLNYIRMPGEMQIVFRHKSFPIREAKRQPYGVQMMSFLFDISPHDNPAFDSMTKVPNKGNRWCFSSMDDDANLDFGRFMPERMNYYYQYTGSLSEPPCTYPVNWTVWHNPVHISHKQMEALRNFRTIEKDADCPKGNDCMMYNNFRQQQCRNKRQIYYGKDCGVHRYQRP